MNSILSQQTNLEQQSVGLIFQALTAQVEAYNRGVDFVVAGVSGVVSAGLTAAVVKVAENLSARKGDANKEPDAKTKVKKTTETETDAAAPTAAATATATPANNIASVDSSSQAKTSAPVRGRLNSYQVATLTEVMNRLSPTLGLMISDALIQALSGGSGSQMYSEDKADFGLEKDDYFKDGGDIQQEGGETSGPTPVRAETEGSVGFMDTSQLETAMFANALLSAGYDVRKEQFERLGQLYHNVGKAYADQLKDLFKNKLKNQLKAEAEKAENKAADDLVKDRGEEALTKIVMEQLGKLPTHDKDKVYTRTEGVKALVRAFASPRLSPQDKLISKLILEKWGKLAVPLMAGNQAAKAYNEANKDKEDFKEQLETPVTNEQIAKAVVGQLRADALGRAKAADGRSAGTGSVGQMGAQRAGLMGIIPLRDALEKMESAGAAPELTKDLKVLLGTATGSTAGIKSAATALGADDNVVSAALKNMAVGSSAQPELKPLTAIWSGAASLGRAISGGISNAGTAIVGVFTRAGAAYTTASVAAPVAAPVAGGVRNRALVAGISEMARGVSGVLAALFSVGTDLAKGSWDAVRYGVPALGSAVMAGGRAVFSAGAYVVGAVRNRASASTAIMKDGKYTDYFMGLDVDQRTKLLESEFKKAGGGSALSQGLTDLAANMAASADRKGFQAKSDALLAKVGKSMEANLVSQPGGVGDDKNRVLAMSGLEQALIGMASYNLSLEVSARLAGTTLDQSGLSRADLKLAQAVLDANGLGNSPSGGYRFLRGAVAVVSLNMLEVDPKGAGLRWGSGPVSAATSAIGSARSGLYRLAGNFFGRGSEFKYEVASEVGTRALDKTKLDAFREGLNQNAVEAALTTAFDGNGVKAKQVMEVLTGKATQVAVDKLKDSVSREKFDIKQQERRVLFLAFGNEGSEILKGLEYIEDVGLKARQKSIESYSFDLKENALERRDLVSGAGTQRDDAYAAEGRGFDRRTAAVAFADIKDAALGTSRFETRGTEFAKKFEEAKDMASKNSNNPGGYLTQMYDVERDFRAELTHLIVTHDDKRAGEMIKGALGSGKEGRELVSRVMQGLAVQDMAYGSAMFKRVMETTIARYSRNDEVMRGLGEAVATAVEKAGAGSRIAGLTMETPGLALRAYRSVHDVLLGDSARGVTAKQVGDSFAASVGDSDISRAVMGRGWWGKVIDAGLGHAPVTDSEPVVDSSNIKQVETRMANAVAGQLSEIKGFGTLASHMGDDDMARMVKALDPDKKDKLIKFVEAGSGVTELDKAGRILDKAAAEYTKSLKSVGAKQKLNDALVNYAEFAVTEFSQMISREMADGRSDGSGKSLALGLEVMEKAAARVHFVEKSMGDPTHSISESISNVAKKVAAVPLPQVPITEETRLAYVGQLETALGGTLATAREQEGATMNPLLVDAVLLPANSKMESMFLLGINAAKSRGDHNKPLAALSGETMLALSKLKASDNKAEVLAFMERLKIAVDFDAEPAEGQSRDDWMSLKKEQYEDYSKNTKPGTYSDFSDLNRSNGEVPTIELKKRANGVLQKVLELSATGDFGSINQLLGNIGRTGGASGNLLIEMVGVELRRLGKQQQLEQYLKQSNTNSEEMIKTVSLDKKFQQDAKDKFAKALRGDTKPVSLEEYHLMDSDRLAGMKEHLDVSEALVSWANELGGSPAKLKAVMSDPSAVGLLGKLLAQGAAMYLPGAKRLIDTLLKMEDTSAYGLQELGEAVADAGLRIDYYRGDSTVSVREEIEKLVTEVKDAQIKLESKPEVKGPIAEKAEGFVTAIKLGYQGRSVAPLSREERVTQAKIMLLGGPAAVDKAKSDFQNFARVDPTGAAILIKDLDAVTPNHANTLLSGFNTKNLSPSDAVGLAKALQTAAEATDEALSAATLTVVSRTKADVDTFIAASPDISPNPKTRRITQNVMAGSDFKAEVKARATELLKEIDGGSAIGVLANKMAKNETLSKDELQKFNENIDSGVESKFRTAARELAHLVLAETNPPLFLVRYTINAGRNGASTMLASDAVREKLKTALADSDIPSETRMDCAATLARGAILGGAPIKDMAETLANLVTNSQANPTARSELLKPGSASATAIRSHIEGKPEFAVLREEMNPVGEKFQAMTKPQKLAFMGVPGSANSLATESPGTYVSFLMSRAADGVANVDKDRLRDLLYGAGTFGQRIAAASPRTLVLAEAATGCIKLSMRAAIATGTDADADVFIAGCKTAATGIAADFTTTGANGLQEMALQTLDSLKSAGQVVARRTEYTGGVLIDLARKIETKQKNNAPYTGELNTFCATVSGQDPALGRSLTAAIQGGADFTRLTQLMATITPDAVVLPKKEAILLILSRGLMDGVAKGQT